MTRTAGAERCLRLVGLTVREQEVERAVLESLEMVSESEDV